MPGVYERELPRVQRLAFESAQRIREFRTASGGKSQPPPVNRIAHQRIAGMRQVHANLMRASRFQFYIQQREPAVSRLDAKVRDCRTATFHNAHFLALNRVPAN